jgi:AraC family transcriptional regulator
MSGIEASVVSVEGGSGFDAEPPGLIYNTNLRSTVQIEPADSVKRLGTGFRWWFSESVYLPIGSKIECRFEGAAHLLVAYNEGLRRNGETSIDGALSSSLRSVFRKLTFVPAGSAYRESHETSAPTRLTFLYVDPAAFRKTGSWKDWLQPRIYFEDSVVWDTASKLKAVIESGEAKCTVYLEALSEVLAHELSRANQKVSRERVAMGRGGLASWQKRVVLDYVEEHLSEQARLSRLAAIARLSVHHFCRAFKQSFGMSAHQYQVKRRMELAKVLLAEQETSVTDIALSLGYAQTGSFSDAFRKATGWTPTAYRREFKMTRESNPR